MSFKGQLCPTSSVCVLSEEVRQDVQQEALADSADLSPLVLYTSFFQGLLFKLLAIAAVAITAPEGSSKLIQKSL